MALLIDIARNSILRGEAPRALRASAWNYVGSVMLVLLGILYGEISAVAVEESPQVLEQRVKAAFLFKFGGYVEWPDSAFPSKDAPLIIGVAGNDSLADELSQVVAGRTMNGRPVSIRRLRGGDPLPSVHVLYVGRPEMGRLADLVAQARPILTVTDSEKGLAQGSIINFVVADNRVRFEVSLDAAKRSGLRIGAPLLSVAMRVQG